MEEDYTPIGKFCTAVLLGVSLGIFLWWVVITAFQIVKSIITQF